MVINMKTKKKLHGAVGIGMAVLLLANGLSGCAQEKTNEPAAYHIGYIGIVGNEPSEDLKQAIEKQAATYDAAVSFSETEDTVDSRLEQIQAWHQEEYDAIIVDAGTARDVGTLAIELEDIPTVYIQTKPEDETIFQSGKAVYVGMDDALCGKVQGEYVAGQLQKEEKTEAEIVLLTGTLGAEKTDLRTNAFKEALEQADISATYVLEAAIGGDRALAGTLLQQFLISGAEIDAIVCNEGPATLGVLDALEALEDTPECIVIGAEDGAVARAAIKSKMLSGVAVAEATAYGQAIVDCAMGMVQETALPEVQDGCRSIEPTILT